jgi:hypothetical protein
MYHGTQTQNSNNMPRVPIGYCVRFHLGNFCQLPCQYNHKCFVCNSPHSSIKCWHLGESGNQSGTRFNNGAHIFRPSWLATYLLTYWLGFEYLVFSFPG